MGSRKEHNMTVNTGGEMGQILDHLVCATDRKIRFKDGCDALKLHFTTVTAKDGEIKALKEALQLIADRTCENSRTVDNAILWCFSRFGEELPLVRWCSPCIARRGLGEK